MRVGQKYKLVRHPHTPIGTITEVDATMDLVTVEWDNKELIPPMEKYPLEAFSNGAFELIPENTYAFEGGNGYCYGHNWKEYFGFKEYYEYCTRCDMKRFKQ